jgi:hypothetical protein
VLGARRSSSCSTKRQSGFRFAPVRRVRQAVKRFGTPHNRAITKLSKNLETLSHGGDAILMIATPQLSERQPKKWRPFIRTNLLPFSRTF